MDKTTLATDSQLNTLSIDGVISLATDNNYTTIVNSSSLNLNFVDVFVGLNGAISVSPYEYQITTFPVYVPQKQNIWNCLPNVYNISSTVITTSSYRLIQGKYVVDTSNAYTLYVNEGTDYFIHIDTSKIGIYDITNYTFTSQFAQNSTSTTKHNITCTVLDNQTLKLSIPSSVTNGIYGKFTFDVLMNNGNTINRIINGNIIISETITQG